MRRSRTIGRPTKPWGEARETDHVSWFFLDTSRPRTSASFHVRGDPCLWLSVRPRVDHRRIEHLWDERVLAERELEVVAV